MLEVSLKDATPAHYCQFILMLVYITFCADFSEVCILFLKIDDKLKKKNWFSSLLALKITSDINNNNYQYLQQRKT